MHPYRQKLKTRQQREDKSTFRGFHICSRDLSQLKGENRAKNRQPSTVTQCYDGENKSATKTGVNLGRESFAHRNESRRTSRNQGWRSDEGRNGRRESEASYGAALEEHLCLRKKKKWTRIERGRKQKDAERPIPRVSAEWSLPKNRTGVPKGNRLERRLKIENKRPGTSPPIGEKMLRAWQLRKRRSEKSSKPTTGEKPLNSLRSQDGGG